MINEKAKIERKGFFKLTGFAMLGIGLTSFVPFKFLQSSKENKLSLKITENPNAVRRSKNDRGVNG